MKSIGFFYGKLMLDRHEVNKGKLCHPFNLNGGSV